MAFHSQQSAEKSLKAFLTFRQTEFPKTHDIGELLALVAGTDAGLAASLHPAVLLTAPDIDILNARTGRHRWGYTDPSEAAWEILEEAVEPYVSEMKRLLERGMAEAAAKTCRGIVLGLYRARGKNPTGVLG